MNDELFEALANRDRRRLLIDLLEYNPLEAGDLQYPNAVPVADDQSTDFMINMVHVHLPKLVDMGFIDWEQESNTIVTGARFEEIRPLLGLLDEHRAELPDEGL